MRAWQGRPSSALRYQVLLQEMLGQDIVYMPISTAGGGKIDPGRFAMALRGINSIGGAISKDVKGTIAAELDEVDELAAAIGAAHVYIYIDLCFQRF